MEVVISERHNGKEVPLFNNLAGHEVHGTSHRLVSRGPVDFAGELKIHKHTMPSHTVMVRFIIT